METKSFGKTRDGRETVLITLKNDEMECRVADYGATLVSLRVPGKDGEARDVVLGFDSVEGYESHRAYFGASIGRYANRIGGSSFELRGVRYDVTPNQPPNHLHGGASGFDKRVWDHAPIPGGVRFSLRSPDMDEGYPGNLDVSIEFTLERRALKIKYSATSDADTVCNLTNHSYFNLDGHDAGTAMDHALKLYSREYTPVADAGCITSGEIAAVEGTPMDFREPTRIGERIDMGFEQLAFGSGYDHNWVVEGEIGKLRPAAEARGQKSGIAMKVETTLPGIQFYAGNLLTDCPPGKGGAGYGRRCAFCLETQFYPDSPNKPSFPQPLLEKGGIWEHTTVFRFESR